MPGVLWHDPATGQVVAARITFVELLAEGRITVLQLEGSAHRARSWQVQGPQVALEWAAQHSPAPAATLYVALDYWDGQPTWVVARAEATHHDDLFDARSGNLVYDLVYPEPSSSQLPLAQPAAEGAIPTAPARPAGTAPRTRQWHQRT